MPPEYIGGAPIYMTPIEIARLIQESPWPQSEQERIMAIILAENQGEWSDGISHDSFNAHTTKIPINVIGETFPPGYGLLQHTPREWRPPFYALNYTPEQFADPATNLSVGYALWSAPPSAGGGYRNWATEGLIGRFLPYAKEAFAVVRSEWAPYAFAMPFTPPYGDRDKHWVFDRSTGRWYPRHDGLKDGPLDLDPPYYFDHDSNQWRPYKGEIRPRSVSGQNYVPGQEELIAQGGIPGSVTVDAYGQPLVRGQLTNAPGNPMDLHEWAVPGKWNYLPGDPRFNNPSYAYGDQASGNSRQWVQDSAGNWYGNSQQYPGQSDTLPNGGAYPQPPRQQQAPAYGSPEWAPEADRNPTYEELVRMYSAIYPESGPQSLVREPEEHRNPTYEELVRMYSAKYPESGPQSFVRESQEHRKPTYEELLRANIEREAAARSQLGTFNANSQGQMYVADANGRGGYRSPANAAFYSGMHGQPQAPPITYPQPPSPWYSSNQDGGPIAPPPMQGGMLPFGPGRPPLPVTPAGNGLFNYQGGTYSPNGLRLSQMQSGLF